MGKERSEQKKDQEKSNGGLHCLLSNLHLLDTLLHCYNKLVNFWDCYNFNYFRCPIFLFLRYITKYVANSFPVVCHRAT